jgi:hypothetical protein
MEAINLQRSALGNHLLQLVNKGLVEKLERGIYRISMDGEDLIESIAHRYLDTKVREHLRMEKQLEENLRLLNKYATIRNENIIMTYRRDDLMTKDRQRLVLKDVQKVDYTPKDGRYEFTPFPSCLKSCLVYLGDPSTYEYLTATSGAAFRLMWHSKKWEGGNVDLFIMAEHQEEPIHRAFESVGYSYELILNDQWREDPEMVDSFHSAKKEGKEYIRKRIITSINENNLPVLCFGVIGPPECCIITGYDNNGEVLIGWNFFQDIPEFNANIEFESSGYFRQPNWFDKTLGSIFIGKKIDRPPTKEIYRKALEWAVEVIRKPKVRDFHNGLASYSVWAEKLQQEEEFPQDDLRALAERKMVHYDAMTMVSERSNGAKFLKQIATHESFQLVKDDLLAASTCFETEVSCMAEWWKIVGQIWDDELAQIKKVGDPKVRKKFVPFVLKARENDEKAAEYIEKALSK